jgi:beta-galactosidase
MFSRRRFLSQTQSLSLGAIALAPLPADAKVSESQHNAGASAEATQVLSLDGNWLFRTDPDNSGVTQTWYGAESEPRTPVSGSSTEWREISVPHTWQIEPPLTEYRGVAWYRRTFDVGDWWRGRAIRVEFEAVFHSASVWVNGAPAGKHIGKPYTAFELDITKLLQFNRPNTITVRVDNSFNEHMLPRGRSSDWAHDGGIYRPVKLLISPKVFIQRIDVEAAPEGAAGEAKLAIAALLCNTGTQSWNGRVAWRVVDEATGLTVLTNPTAANISLSSAGSGTAIAAASFPNAKLWHFDHPNLYRLEMEIADGHTPAHSFCTTFGVRSFEVKSASFYLNGERVRLMGVERMAGSNPEFGMAEPAPWIAHDHDDLKNLNCIFTRVHWQQDQRVLDYCDRNGIMLQTEVPTWGADTFKGMGEEPDPDIMQNGLEQLREMVARDRNHPSIVAWGLCNEINGQNPPAYNFAKNMLAEAKRLDPNRLCSYASHSLRQTPGKDVAGLMDFIECNEYFGSWYPGDATAVGRNVDEIHAAFPDKPIVISEYGYCACTADRPEGDERRREVMLTHDEVLRTRDFIGGLIFFCYNDYRTHIGDRGTGVMRQRVHGVVDLYGNRKGSYEMNCCARNRDQLKPLLSKVILAPSVLLCAPGRQCRLTQSKDTNCEASTTDTVKFLLSTRRWQCRT